VARAKELVGFNDLGFCRPSHSRLKGVPKVVYGPAVKIVVIVNVNGLIASGTELAMTIPDAR
jgi:hypothetical protein